MRAKYRISEKARDDLERIWFYTLHEWSEKQADRYHRLLIDEIEYIVDNNELSQNMDHVRLGYRMSKVKSYMIFFKKSEDNIIEVIRILHQMMDIENRLKGEK
jgi:toxin ParE1/3/4